MNYKLALMGLPKQRRSSSCDTRAGVPVCSWAVCCKSQCVLRQPSKEMISAFLLFLAKVVAVGDICIELNPQIFLAVAAKRCCTCRGTGQPASWGFEAS